MKEYMDNDFLVLYYKFLKEFHVVPLTIDDLLDSVDFQIMEGKVQDFLDKKIGKAKESARE